MNGKIALFIFWNLLAAACFSGCKPMKIASTPEQAVIQQASRAMGPQAAILQDFVHVRQTLELDGKTLLMLTLDRFYQNHWEPCLVVYETAKTSLGTWKTGLGDTVCQTAQSPVAEEHPLDVNGAWRKGSRADEPGLSYAAGLVHQAQIKKVQVTWMDGKKIIVDVIDGSYLATNSGAFQFNLVEGLGANDEVLYSLRANRPTD